MLRIFDPHRREPEPDDDPSFADETIEVPIRIASDPSLTLSAKLIYGAIRTRELRRARRHTADGKRLAEMFGISVGVVRRSIQKLEESGLVARMPSNDEVTDDTKSACGAY
jgi:DNA-binding MarR family transcriptional regulator